MIAGQAFTRIRPGNPPYNVRHAPQGTTRAERGRMTAMGVLQVGLQAGTTPTAMIPTLAGLDASSAQQACMCLIVEMVNPP